VTIVATTYEFVRQSPALAGEPEAGWKLVDVKEIPTICCYCGCGCGGIVSVRDGELINIEGDPDHPVNRGALCAKGSAQFGVHSVYDPDTQKIPSESADQAMVRHPGSDSWGRSRGSRPSTRSPTASRRRATPATRRSPTA
jgi:formate dehydrogenase major subunit